jgi:carbon monoxide dehydrogenase subunit G
MTTESFSHQSVLRLPRNWVYACLLDADVLKRCFDDCDQFELDKDFRFRIDARYKLGPFSRRFKGTIMVVEGITDEYLKFRRGSYKAYEGPGAFSGIVRLTDHEQGTLLDINMDLEISPLLRPILQFFTGSGSSSMIRSFIERFEQVVQEKIRIQKQIASKS